MSPRFYLRVGTHAEVEPYVLRRGIHDGVVVAANLLEATPGATATMVARIRSGLGVDYWLDPYTHVFSLEPSLLKSQRKSGAYELKATFSKLANSLGAPFSHHVGTRPLVPIDFPGEVADEAARAVIDYQLHRIERLIAQDDKASGILRGWHPLPEYLFAPYFPIWSSRARPQWLERNLRFVDAATEAAREADYRGAGAVICADMRVLTDAARLSEVVGGYRGTKASAFFLWLSDMDETTADVDSLRGLVRLATALSETGRPVFSLHGGFFSMAMSYLGLNGYSHGVGYGEHRDIEPATGGGLPPEKFYFPSLHSRVRQSDAQEAIKRLGVASVEDYHAVVCGCPVCRVVVKDSLADFSAFSELGPVKINAKGVARRYPTQESIQRCRYHFLLNRRRERQMLGRSTLDDVRVMWREWSDRFEARGAGGALFSHLNRWTEALKGQ